MKKYTDRYHIDIHKSRTITSKWEAFQHTRLGDMIAEHTDIIRHLAQGGGEAHKTMLLLAFMATVPMILISLVLHNPWSVLLIVSIFTVVLTIEEIIWSFYDGTPQQEADRLLFNRQLLNRRGCNQLLSDRALSYAANHALPATRAALDTRLATQNQPISPSLAGILVGSSHNISVWLSYERPVYVLAPPRSGKTTSVVVPAIVEASGAVVATSSRRDILDATFMLRTRGYTTNRQDFDGSAPASDGDQAYVFDPMGMVDDIPEYKQHRIRWNPVPSCIDPKRARTLASALVNSAQFSAEDATWARIGVDITQALLLAAALEGYGLDTVFTWSQDIAGINTALSILRRHPENSAAQSWMPALIRLSKDDHRTMSNKLLTMSSAFSALSLPQVRQWFAPSDEPSFDMEAFLHSRQTVYMLSELRSVTGQADASTAVFNCLFLDDVRDTARKIAARSRYQKLEPPVSLILDECANISPWPQLPQLFTAGTGDGIWPMAVFQSREQATAAFGKEEPQMWDSGQKIIMGGLAERKTLEEISRLTVEYDRSVADHSYRTTLLGTISLGDAISTNERHETRPALKPEDVRTIPPECALIISHSIPATAMRLIPHWKREWHEKTSTTKHHNEKTLASSTGSHVSDWQSAPLMI
jgi:type IV secretion system protein VirD4